MLHLFHESSFTCSRKVTELYSTSFTLGIKALDRRYHDAIYAIYGFVRYADEIVDTFHDWDKQTLLLRFKEDTWSALDEKISLNPILHAFQLTVHKYQIDRNLIDAFLHSMEMDLHMSNYKQHHYEEYIYGSAEVVGLMCLKVFCENDETHYQKLIQPARFLGAAFQKVNFLRDLQSDYKDRGRVYFPNVDFENFCERQKTQIEQEIANDFDEAYKGIKQLPEGAKFGVYLAYKYYLELFKKIRSTEPEAVMQTRIRVSNPKKIGLWASLYLRSNVLGIYAP
ncbi:MAG TPA: phytoene/squalene synthase family protein [Chitinophagales bacterium]|nr:phytoene/squalene synthase family protein [Chitinophagales bacterium]HMU68437.1 phytoene/squalene synthase family protein [Chitinophagales bacterium]HMX05540.1 phytoene/squalene synthase family protein [Chitinophagales bacterium]HMZ88259.1 phytoene/squalene synthase family protein [Chitinophagales bacterium]HNE45574.1 phytoene/squalene synthase family protein [Chitinophagales bacterium]